ncbi:MAG: hypothetical protein P8M20_05380 [Planctomycetaceae bacterium]|nr:hypothetical protein [Planctomycetaceae bacterium]
MFRQFLISTTLVAHAAAALLGHAGLHAVMGHDHGEHTAQPSLDSEHGHHHAHSAHNGHSHHDGHEHTAHSHANHDDGQPSSPAPSHHHDGDCLVCQFAEQHQSPLAFFHIPASADISEPTAAETVQLAPTRFESVYDSRGPPAV